MYFLQRKLLIKKIGISILEIIVSIGISLLIISMLVPMYFSLNNSYKTSIIKDREYFYLKEAFAYIENEITQNTISAEFSSNKISLKKNDATEKQILASAESFNTKTIRVNYYKNNVLQASNIILRNIKDLNVVVKNNLLYVTIILPDDRYQERCLPLNSLK